MYSWFNEVYDQLDRTFSLGHLPHALLFQIQKDTGAETLIDQLAKGLICYEGNGLKPCNGCSNCKLWQDNQAHPDVFEVAKDDTVIRIDAIRALRERIYLTAHIGNQSNARRVIIIRHLTRMNEASANALLKMLEEPPSNTYFLLETDKIDQLLPTIISRCQLVYCKVNLDQALTWLSPLLDKATVPLDLNGLWHLTKGRPLMIKRLIEEPFIFELRNQLLQYLTDQSNDLFDFIQSVQDQWFDQIIFWLYTLMADIMKLKLNAVESLVHQDCLKQLQIASQHYDYEQVLSQYQKLIKWQEACASGYHLNKTLWLEDWFYPDEK